MNLRERIWAVIAVALVAVAVGTAVGIACYQAGYQRGKRDASASVSKQPWEGSAYEQMTGELGQCVRALQSVSRNPGAFTPEERQYWRDQTRLLVRTLEQELLPRLARGEKFEAHGEVIDERPVRRLLERARKLLARVPA
jgi:hypothetical protein